MNDLDKMHKSERIKHLAHICQMYYIENKTQSEIAKYYNSNRFKIAKWLQQAKDEKIVDISIHHPQNRCHDLEDSLKKHLHLDDVLVLDSQCLPHYESIKHLGLLGANYLDNLINDNSVIGVSWGKTLHSVITQMPNDKSVSIKTVQLTGYSNLRNPEMESSQLARFLADCYGGTPNYIYAPLYTKDIISKQYLYQEPLISRTFDCAKHLDIVITGLSSTSSLALSNPLWNDYLSAEDLSDHSIAGSIYGRIINKDGRILQIPLNQKLIAVDLESILNAKHRIVVALGRHKIDLMIGIAKMKLMNVLITDQATAVAILAKFL